jgi:hypothetical protein
MTVYAYRIGCVPRIAYEAINEKCKALGGGTIYHGASSDGTDISVAAPDKRVLERMCDRIGVRFIRDYVYETDGYD